jgi:glycosyl transferase, family 25
MRAVLINLDRSQDRLAAMTAEFLRVGLAFDRFSAVDGIDLPGSVQPFFCDASGQVISPMRVGEIGCYASHLAVWQRIAAGEYGSAALVCEDDMRFPDEFASFLPALLARAPSGWDLIRLSPRTKHAVVCVREIADGYSLVRYSRQPASAAAYLLSLDGARKLLAPGVRIRPVDQDFRRPWAFDLESFGVWPPMPEGHRSRSTIDEMGGRIRLARRWGRWSVRDAVLRPAYGIRVLGLRQWCKCAAWNLIGRKLRRASPQAIRPAGRSP